MSILNEKIQVKNYFWKIIVLMHSLHTSFTQIIENPSALLCNVIPFPSLVDTTKYFRLPFIIGPNSSNGHFPGNVAFVIYLPVAPGRRSVTQTSKSLAVYNKFFSTAIDRTSSTMLYLNTILLLIHFVTTPLSSPVYKVSSPSTINVIISSLVFSKIKLKSSDCVIFEKHFIFPSQLLEYNIPFELTAIAYIYES